MLLVDNLAEHEDPPAVAESEEEDAAEFGQEQPPRPTLQGVRAPILVAGARGHLDQAAAAMLGQLLERLGTDVHILPAESLQSARLRDVDIAAPRIVVLSYMNPESLAHARFLVRRVRRRFPEAAIMVGLWTYSAENMARRDPVEATGADRVATSLRDAVTDVVETLAPEREAAPPARLAVAEA
jgi:hypothetical protein